MLFLVQLYKFKIIRIAACFLIIESIDAHVGFLHLLGSIVKRGGGVLHGCYCHYHIGSEDCAIRALEALRLYLKYLAHKHSVFKFILYGCPCFSAETANHLLSRGKDYANEHNESLLSNYRVQLILYKGTGHVCQMMSQVSTISQKSLYHLVPIVPGVAYGRMINSHHNNGSRPIS